MNEKQAGRQCFEGTDWDVARRRRSALRAAASVSEWLGNFGGLALGGWPTSASSLSPRQALSLARCAGPAVPHDRNRFESALATCHHGGTHTRPKTLAHPKTCKQIQANRFVEPHRALQHVPCLPYRPRRYSIAMTRALQILPAPRFNVKQTRRANPTGADVRVQASSDALGIDGRAGLAFCGS